MNQNIKMIIKRINTNMNNKIYFIDEDYKDIIKEFKINDNIKIKDLSYFYNYFIIFILRFKYIIILFIFLCFIFNYVFEKYLKR